MAAFDFAIISISNPRLFCAYPIGGVGEVEEGEPVGVVEVLAGAVVGEDEEEVAALPGQ